MLGDLPRKDQRAAGELHARGLLTDGQRKSMQPMAARLGADHQRLQQFITSSTWDYAAVRGNVARWFAASQRVDALVVDDTGFPKDGDASPCVARQYSGTLGKKANCQVAVSVHLVDERAWPSSTAPARYAPSRSPSKDSRPPSPRPNKVLLGPCQGCQGRQPVSRRRLLGAQNTRIWTACIVIGLEPTPVHIGGSACVLPGFFHRSA
jgi:DDE superfamily endonuclease